ncbi:MAG: CoA transferase [Betaproteobacteria bacterium]
MSGPLEGVRVLDLTNALMGPYAARIIGDLGADVIKVESREGDLVRGTGPARHAGMSNIYLNVGRSKRSLMLDLKHPKGRAALLRLAKNADVLLYNIRPQAMRRLGLSYDDVRAVNPRIIYCGAYGYGQDGPYAAKPAFDDLIQGAVAMPYLVQRVGGEPRFATTAVCDRSVGLHIVYSVLAALFYRERKGVGQAVDVPMFETMADMVLSDHLYGKTFDPPEGEMGYVRMLSRERRPFPTRDGHVCVMPYTEKHWFAVFDAIGRPELKSDPRFATIAARTTHTEEIYRILGEGMAARTTEEWVAVLDAADVPVMRLNTLETLLADPHLAATGFFRFVEHPSEGRIRSMAIAQKFSASPPEVTRHAPRLGEHSVEVLREAGLDEADIKALLDLGVSCDARTA